MHLFSKVQLPLFPPRLLTWSRFQVEMFIGLLLRAMKNDVNLKRVAAFSKRLLQVIYILYSLFASVFPLNMLR